MFTQVGRLEPFLPLVQQMITVDVVVLSCVFTAIIVIYQVQQVLTQAGELERFLPASDAQELRQCFAGLWAVGEPGDQEGV